MGTAWWYSDRLQSLAHSMEVNLLLPRNRPPPPSEFVTSMARFDAYVELTDSATVCAPVCVTCLFILHWGKGGYRNVIVTLHGTCLTGIQRADSLPHEKHWA